MISTTKKHRKKVATLLSSFVDEVLREAQQAARWFDSAGLLGIDEIIEDLTDAMLDTFQEVYADRAKFAVAAQLYYQDGYVYDEERRDSRVVLSSYPTEAQARNAGQSLAYGNGTHEEWKWWIVPVWHGSPAEFHRSRQQAHEAEKLKQRPSVPGRHELPENHCTWCAHEVHVDECPEEWCECPKR